MRRWLKLLGLEALAATLSIVAAAPAVAQDGPDLAPAPEAAIVSGGKACIGVTVDPAGQAARVQGWGPLTPAQAQQVEVGNGNVLTRDNVLLIYKAGVDGGCVAIARGDAAFDKAKFYTDLSAAAGTTVTPSDQPTQVDLPNGEILLVIVTAASGQTNVQLIVANKARMDAKKGN